MGKYRTADERAQIEWELKTTENGPEFSACGEFDGHMGQCVDRIAAAYPADEIVQRIAAVWERWHLNGMKAGLPKQEEFLRKWWAGWAAKYPDLADAPHALAAKIACFPDCKDRSHYALSCAALATARLLTVRIPAGAQAVGGWPTDKKGQPVKKYRYGTRWVFEPIPAGVLKEIASWPDKPLVPLHEDNARKFFRRHGLKMRITLSDSKPCPWDEDHAGHHYRVTISGEGRRIAFDFWGSVNDAENHKAPSVYSVLACISSDIHSPESFGDYCSEFGEEEDSRRALQTFRRLDRFAKRLRDFFTAEELEALAEIR